jgi:hypothetical protein
MAQKYLTLQEAAKKIGLTPDELEREREDGTIRGFANRGSWKFREVDVDEFIRSRETDSSPEIQLEALELELEKGDDSEMTDLLDSSDSDVQLYSESSLFDDDEIADLKASDSDVRLTGDSDSDVKLSRSETSSDIRLMSDDADDDGTETVMVALPEDSDLELIDSLDQGKTSDSGRAVSLAAADEEDSGISLEIGDSGISLEADDSGISLEGVDSGFADDSGISLDGADSDFLSDIGISLDAGDSGVALMADADSGISLDSDTATVQMDLQGEEPGLEVAAADVSATDGTSEFDLGLLDGEEQDTGTDTSILTFDGAEAEAGDMEMSADGTDFADEDGDFDDDFSDDYDDDELDDVFEADDDDGFESGQSQVGGFAVPTGASAGVEAPWGRGVTAGVIIGSLFSVVGAFAGFELVRTMWMWFQPGVGESAFLQMIGGLFG